MTTTTLKRKLKALDQKWGELLDATIAAGLGDVRPSEMRSRVREGTASEAERAYVAFLDERAAIKDALAGGVS